MRAGLSTIQQTLTPEAGAVLNHSIAEAGRRNHGQTTPLHVAATLLASPSGFLRQACIRSHPNSSHPLQCRALELCFSVALERLPTSQNMEPGTEPPISNALMAALKRAQAHQRKGCPEQQQQPLLAVKVELEQLIISILDDPSVSRVMREASFSSPAVKATIEQSLNTNPHPHPNPLHLPHSNGHVNLGSSFGGVIGSSRMLMNPQSALAPTCVSPMPNRNMFINPKLRQAVSGPSGNQRTDELKKILDILMRFKKKNPVLVGDSEPESVVKELIRKINHGELGTNSPLNNIQVISIFKELNSDKNHLIMKIKQLADLVENRVKDYASILIDLGDLKWVVEPTASNSGGMQQQQQNSVSDAGKEAVMEMGKLLTKLTEMNNAGKVWLIGTATCETYLRCQVYHPTMENDWDLQAVPIAARSPLPGMLPRFGNERITSNSIEPLIPLKSFQTMVPTLTKPSFENPDLSRKLSGLQPSNEKNEHGSNITTKDIESCSVENKSEPSRSSLPQWLQNAKLHNGESNKATDDLSQNKDQAILLKQNAPEMQKILSDACLNLHNLNRNVVSEKIRSPMSLYNPKLFLHQPTQPRLMTTYGKTLQLNPNIPSQQAGTPPGSPVRTDLVLGRKDSEKICQEETVKDFLGGISTEQPQMKLTEKFANALDAASFKKLLKGLMDCAWWQPEAASMVASAVTRCQLGNGKQRASGTKSDIWLLFTGPDRIGKRKMGSVLSEQMCGSGLVIISLGSKRDDKELDTNTNIRGRTALDRIVESVRRNPFAVIMLEDIDEADFLLRGNIKRAMEKGRLTDTHGREISLGNVIFILTGNWSTFEDNHHLLDENKLADAVNGDWNLKLTIGQKSSNSKRRAHWLSDSDRPIKQRIEPISGLSFDLNQSVGLVDDRNDGSYNSSDLTVDHDEEHGHETRQFAITSVPQELVNFADEAIAFKPVDFSFVRREIKKTLSVKLLMVIDNNLSIQIEDNALEKIIGGLLHGRCNLTEWVDKALTPGFEILKGRLPLSPESPVVHLRLHQNAGTDDRSNGDWLPSKVAVMVDEATSV